MKYIFPRQFRLHNVFTFVRDHKETALPFKDYNMRETEIRLRNGGKDSSVAGLGIVETAHMPRLPKRLRGLPFELVLGLRKLHRRCSYVELLKHHCPLSVSISVPPAA
jgi:telomerase reverse transcriptase